MRLILDITRILLRRMNTTPTGIDRVELAYLARLLRAGPSPEVHFVVSTHAGCGVVAKETVRRLYNETMQRWGPQDEAASPQFRKLMDGLREPIDQKRITVAQFGQRQRDSWSAGRHAKLVPLALRGWPTLLRLALEAKRIPTYYLHVSHVCLEHPYIFNWTMNGTIKPVFFLHDIIPIDYPEFCGDNAYRKHLKRVQTAANLGHAIIVNSDYTKQRLDGFLAETRRDRTVPVVVSWLGTEMPAPAMAEALNPSVPYFVHVGTIEARKNLYHLLNVWRRMLAVDGPERTPRLIIAGRRGWKSQNVLDVLDRGRELASHVAEVSDFNDAELATLISNAAGVLAPSLVEGFGLPGAEALGRGTPVVASDIPAHREVLGDAAVLLDPTDGVAWAEAIRKLAWSEEFQRERRDAARSFRSVTWDRHVELALNLSIPTLALQA